MKRTVFFIFFLFFIFLPYGFLFSFWFFIGGKYQENWRVEITSEIRTSTKNIVAFVDFFEPTDFSNAFNTQQITFLTSNVRGEILSSENMTTLPELILRRFLVKFDKRDSFFINKSYKIKTILNFDNFSVDFPYSFSKEPLQQQQFLKLPYSIPPELRHKVIELVKEKKNIPSVIVAIYNWIKSFELLLFEEPMSIEESLRRKQLNISNTIDLWLYALRIAKIPCRVVHGYSLPLSLSFEHLQEKYSLIYPRGIYHWIEIFIEGIGWMPIDVFADTLFFIPQNLIRKSFSLYYKSNQDKIYVYPQKPQDMVFYQSIFSEKEMEEKKLKIETVMESNAFLLSLPFVSDTIPIQENNYYVSFMPQKKSLYSGPLKIDFEVGEDNPLTQKIFFAQSKKFSSVVLPLYFLEINKFAEIWVEVTVGDKVYKSSVTDSHIGKQDMEYLFVPFHFSQEIELKGEVYLTLKAKNVSVVLWYGVIGNPIGDKKDTFRNPRQYLHADMCYEFR